MSESQSQLNEKLSTKFLHASRLLTACIQSFQNVSYDLRSLIKLYNIAPDISTNLNKTDKKKYSNNNTIYQLNTVFFPHSISLSPDPSSISTKWIQRFSTSIQETSQSLSIFSSDISDAIVSLEQLSQNELSVSISRSTVVITTIELIQKIQNMLQEMIISVRTSYSSVLALQNSIVQSYNLPSKTSYNQQIITNNDITNPDAINSILKQFSVEQFTTTLDYQETVVYNIQSLANNLQQIHNQNNKNPILLPL